MSLPGGGPIGSGYSAGQPLTGARSVDTAVQETVLGSPLDRKKRKRRMANFAGYRSASKWAKTPEGGRDTAAPSQTRLSDLAR